VPKREVRFYELVTTAGERFDDLDPMDLIGVVDAIPAADAYVTIARTELLGSTYRPTRGSAAPPLLVLDRITREVRIRIENRRHYRPLELRPGDTLAEPTHIGLFPRNVLGLLRSTGTAPGPASVREFLNAAYFEDEVAIRPLVDTNALRALAQVGKLTKIDVALDPGATAEVMGTDGFLAEAFDVFRRRTGDAQVEFILKFDPKGRTDVSELAFEELQSLYERGGLNSARKASMSFRRLEDGRADTFDFLNESVAHAIDVDIDDDTGGPSNLSASEGIQAAYDLLRDDIQSALGDNR
jgi:hypothetical protein